MCVINQMFFDFKESEYKRTESFWIFGLYILKQLIEKLYFFGIRITVGLIQQCLGTL